LIDVWNGMRRVTVNALAKNVTRWGQRERVDELVLTLTLLLLHVRPEVALESRPVDRDPAGPAARIKRRVAVPPTPPILVVVVGSRERPPEPDHLHPAADVGDQRERCELQRERSRQPATGHARADRCDGERQADRGNHRPAQSDDKGALGIVCAARAAPPVGLLPHRESRSFCEGGAGWSAGGRGERRSA
jgi:hypothetical protein